MDKINRREYIADKDLYPATLSFLNDWYNRLRYQLKLLQEKAKQGPCK